MRATGHSLWLIPEAVAREALSGTIAELARRLGTPSFEPHVTLIGRLGPSVPEIVAAAEKLAAATPPLELQLARLGHSARYLRCFFYEIGDCPVLTALHSRARSVFRPEEHPPFFPHLSLVYADLDAPTRRRLVEEMSGASREAFDVEELQVVRTEGEVPEWRPLAAFRLTRRD